MWHLQIPLSGRLVLYTTRNKTLLKVDFTVNKKCVANYLCFHQYKEDRGRLDELANEIHFRLSCRNYLFDDCYGATK